MSLNRNLINFYQQIIANATADGNPGSNIQCQEHELLLELDASGVPVPDTGVSLHQLGGFVFAARFGYKSDPASGLPLGLDGNPIAAALTGTATWASDWFTYQGGVLVPVAESYPVEFYSPVGGHGFGLGSSGDDSQVIPQGRHEVLLRMRDHQSVGQDRFQATDTADQSVRLMQSLLTQVPGCGPPGGGLNAGVPNQSESE